MFEARRVGIAALGSYLPERILTNKYWEERVDTSDAWIIERTGIKERHWVAEGETNSDMASRVAKDCIAKAGLKPEDIDLIIIGTVTPDRPLPSTACFVQAKIGAVNAAAFDVVAACSGFLCATQIAASMISSGVVKNAVVLGCEVLSSISNNNDRTTCVLFGDGCGGALYTDWKEGMPELLSTDLASDGTAAEFLTIRAGGQETPLTPELLERNEHKIYMDGSAIFKRAVRAMTDTTQRALSKCGMTNDDITWLVPHQANFRILLSTARNLGIPPERVYINIERTGNTSSASVPIALHEAATKNVFNKGDIIAMCAFGGGLIWGSAVVRW